MEGHGSRYMIMGTASQGQSRMATRKTHNLGFVLLMTLAGLLSGIVTAGACDADFGYGLGAPFGLVIASFLLIGRTIRDPLKAIAIVGLSTVGFYVAVVLADLLALAFPGPGEWSFGGGVLRPPIISLLVSGAFGELVFLLGTLVLTSPRDMRSVLVAKAVAWSPLGGATAAAAWPLGPSFGMWAWLVLHTAGVTSPRNTIQNALYNNGAYGAPNHLYAVFILWQTGTAFALGWNLRSVRDLISHSEPMPSILT